MTPIGRDMEPQVSLDPGPFAVGHPDVAQQFRLPLAGQGDKCLHPPLPGPAHVRETLGGGVCFLLGMLYHFPQVLLRFCEI